MPIETLNLALFSALNASTDAKPVMIHLTL